MDPWSREFGIKTVFFRLMGLRPAVFLHGRWCVSAIALTLTWPSGVTAADVELPRDFSIVQGNGSIYYESFTDNRSGGPATPAHLPYAGVLDIVNGSVVFSGPTYQHQVFGHHTAMHESTRDLLVLHPRLSASESLAASVAFGAMESGWYHVVGSFARANDYRLAGDGVVVMVFVNENTALPLMEAAISADHFVDPDDPFSGTGTADFDEVVWLDQGDHLRFGVFGGPIGSIDGDFDVTALTATITNACVDYVGYEEQAELYSPVDGETDVPVKPTFDWQCTTHYGSSSNVVYRVRINEEYSGDYTAICETTSTSCVPATSLDPDTRYFVHVWAYYEDGGHSEILSDTIYHEFWTTACPDYEGYEVQTELYSPSDYAINVPVQPFFSWQCITYWGSSSDVYYQVRVNQEYTGNYTTICETYSTSCVPATPLDPDTRYFVHVYGYYYDNGYPTTPISDTPYHRFWTSFDGIFFDDFESGTTARWSNSVGGGGSPLANLTLNPQPAFPGDYLMVTNTSAGGTRFATWITDGPDAHGDSILAGNPSLNTGTTLGYTLPSSMSSADVFFAHAAVETDAYPYIPNSTPGQINTQQIAIDRTPQANITISPSAVVTGDSVNLTAEAQGHPADPLGADPYSWTVTNPTGSATNYTGPQVDGVFLHSSGQWTFDLAVQYEHEGSTGGPYSASTQVIRTISSVSAAFSISPSQPTHLESIILSSNSVTQVGASLEFDWDVLNSGTQTIANELSFCDGPGSADEQCVIQAETLTWGTYDFRLTLTNTSSIPIDVSEALVEDFDVTEGNIDVDFTWMPFDPEVCQQVNLSIFGLTGDVRAEWDFGEDGCGGTPQIQVCHPTFTNCHDWFFEFASPGPKTVSVTVESPATGAVLGSATRTIVVQSAGSCDGG